MTTGYRWTAGLAQPPPRGRRRHGARLVGSRGPRRAFSDARPWNAHSIGTCWSRSMPTTRANPSVFSRPSAAGSPVMARVAVHGASGAEPARPGGARGRCRSGRWRRRPPRASRRPPRPGRESTATTTWAASTSKKRRSASRVSERPNPSVPSGMNGRPATNRRDLVGHDLHVVGDGHDRPLRPFEQPSVTSGMRARLAGVQPVPPLGVERLLTERLVRGRRPQLDADVVVGRQLVVRGRPLPGRDRRTARSPSWRALRAPP